MLLRGELRDPRLQPASAVGITGVNISGDLSIAEVYVDVLTESLRLEDVLKALRSASGLVRHKIGERIKLRHTPELRFCHDSTIERGNRIETILSEMRDAGELTPKNAHAGASSGASPKPGASPGASPKPGASPDTGAGSDDGGDGGDSGTDHGASD